MYSDIKLPSALYGFLFYPADVGTGFLWKITKFLPYYIPEDNNMS